MDEIPRGLFRNIGPTRAPAGLRDAIMGRVWRLRRRADAVYLGSLAATAFVSGLGGMYAFRFSATALASSGFFRYASLIFSDTGLVMQNAREFFLSLADAVPAFEVGLLLAATFVFFGSLRLLAKKMGSTLAMREAF